MNLAEYAELDGIALAELIRKKEVTARELMQLAVEGVAKGNPQINAVIEVYADALKIAD